MLSAVIVKQDLRGSGRDAALALSIRSQKGRRASVLNHVFCCNQDHRPERCELAQVEQALTQVVGQRACRLAAKVQQGCDAHHCQAGLQSRSHPLSSVHRPGLPLLRTTHCSYCWQVHDRLQCAQPLPQVGPTSMASLVLGSRPASSDDLCVLTVAAAPGRFAFSAVS